MKITVEISENDLKDVLKFSGGKKKGPAISKFITTELTLRRRQELMDDVLEGKFQVDYPDWRKQRSQERASAAWAR
jgi:hypothetical protein